MMRMAGLVTGAALAMMPVALWTGPAMARAGAATGSAAGSAGRSEADKAFEALSTDEYAWRRQQAGPSEDGPRDRKIMLPDLGPQAQAARLARWEKVEQQLAAIRQDRLSPANRINFAVYKGQIDALLAAQRYRDYEKPFNADTSFWGELADWARTPFRDRDEADAYLEMLREIPRYYDQQIVNMRAGLARGFSAPHVTLTGRDKGIEMVVQAASPEASPFYEPFKNLPATIPAADQEALRAQAREAITKDVVPAHARLLAFMRGEYEKGARQTLAAYALPDGRAYYRSKINEFVTLDKSPEEIHQIGLSEMARIRGQMDAVMKQVGFKGDLKAFLHFLRTDPQFYPKTPNELLYRAAWIAKTFDGKASQFFGRMPRSRFAIKPVPDDVAPFYTGGRGGPGIYLVNTYNLPSRPFYSQIALTLHESAPGHAMQMPLAAENTDLPAFRRDSYLSAYGEGWALCAGRGHGHVRDALRPLRHAQLSGLARLAAGGRYRHPCHGLDARTGAAILARQHRAVRSRDRDRGRPLYFLARPGTGLLHGGTDLPRRAPQGGKGAGAKVQHSCVPRCRARNGGSAAAADRPAGRPVDQGWRQGALSR